MTTRTLEAADRPVPLELAHGARLATDVDARVGWRHEIQGLEPVDAIEMAQMGGDE
jgi:hypothetical protein